MASYNIPYLVGNVLRRHHINWVTILRSEITDLLAPPDPSIYDELWPVDVSLAQILALCWRVRSWHLAGSISVSKTITYTGGVPTPQTATGSATINASTGDVFFLKPNPSFTEEVKADSEFDIVRFAQAIGFKGAFFNILGSDGIGFESANPGISEWSVEADFGTPHWEGTQPIDFGMVAGIHLYDPAGPLFTPPFRSIGGMIPANIAGPPLFASVAFNRNPQTVLSGGTPLVLRAPAEMVVSAGIVPDFTVPMEIGWRFFGEPGPGGGTCVGSGSGAFTLTATEFWVYRNSLGQSIYNKDTGASTGANRLA